MLIQILNALQGGNPKVVPYWKRLFDFTTTRMNVAKERYLRSGIVLSRGFRQLREILTDISFDDIHGLKNDRERYRYIFAHEERLKHHFDAIIQQVSISDIYITNHERKIIPEFHLRTMMKDDTKRLPFDRNWNDWKSLRAVEIIYYNSIELVEQLFPHTLDFRKDPPDYGVVAINVPLLIMQMYQYARTLPAGENRYDRYLHDIVLSQWFDDIVRIWLMNMLERGIDDELCRIENMDMGGWVMQKVPAEITKVVSDEIQKVKTGTNTLSDFLKTPWLGKLSLWDYALHIENEFMVPQLRQYEFCDFMKQLPILKMIVKINRFRGGCADYERITTILKRELLRYKNNNYANNIHSSVFRQKFTKEVESLERLVSFM